MDTTQYFKSAVETTSYPMEAAVQAYRTFQSAPSQFLSARSQFSSQETGALTSYKGFGFSSINSALRQDPGNLSGEGKSVVQTLDELTHSGVVEKEFSVHRGFGRHPLAQAAPGTLVGQEFTDPGFGSTSLNPYVVDEFARDKQGFTAEIRLKQGTKGFLLSSHEAWRQGDKEAEFILPRGTKYRVLEEHAAESSFRPRHLVLEAITPEHRPTPLQLGRQVAHEVRPSAGGAMATAQKMAAKETANELHTVLESGVGGFLKKLLKIPLKAHSQTDALAAAQLSNPSIRSIRDRVKSWDVSADPLLHNQITSDIIDSIIKEGEYTTFYDPSIGVEDNHIAKLARYRHQLQQRGYGFAGDPELRETTGTLRVGVVKLNTPSVVSNTNPTAAAPDAVRLSNRPDTGELDESDRRVMREYAARGEVLPSNHPIYRRARAQGLKHPALGNAEATHQSRLAGINTQATAKPSAVDQT